MMPASNGSGLDQVAERIRRQAQQERARVVRYVVPYSAPGIKWGHLRVDADSPAEALVKAQEIHTRSYHLASTLRWTGPGYKYDQSGTPSRHKLTKRERSQIVYGEPVAQWVEGVA